MNKINGKVFFLLLVLSFNTIKQKKKVFVALCQKQISMLLSVLEFCVRKPIIKTPLKLIFNENASNCLALFNLNLINIETN